jgi:hypothetical protein
VIEEPCFIPSFAATLRAESDICAADHCESARHAVGVATFGVAEFESSGQLPFAGYALNRIVTIQVFHLESIARRHQEHNWDNP